MNPYATPDDLAAVSSGISGLSDPELSVIEGWMNHASRMIRDDIPDVDQRIAASQLDQQTVRNTVVAMVRRIVVLNPAGARTQGTGPFSVTLDTSISASELHLTDREVARLTGKKHTGVKAFTISTTAGAT